MSQTCHDVPADELPSVEMSAPVVVHQPAPWVLVGLGVLIAVVDIWLELHGFETISVWAKHFDQHHHWFKWVVGGFFILLWGHLFKGWLWN